MILLWSCLLVQHYQLLDVSLGCHAVPLTWKIGVVVFCFFFLFQLPSQEDLRFYGCIPLCSNGPCSV